MSDSTKIYLGDGIYLELEIGAIKLSGNRLGERPITVRHAIFKRLLGEGIKHFGGSKKAATLPLLLKMIDRTLPEEEIDIPSQERTVELLAVSPSRDEEMQAWEATLRRKRSEARAAGSANPASPKQPKPIEDLA